ncbi:MAG TPA: hypothetical protein VIV58_20170, partial [Kofleriaceae bacterium]
GAGADVMKRIATPMVGGVVTSFVLELLIYPVIYAVWKGRSLPRTAPGTPVVGNGAHAGGPLMTPGEH